MRRSVSKMVEVEVDVDFEPEDLSDETLLECVKEAARRGLVPPAVVDEERLKDVLVTLMRPLMRQRALGQLEEAVFGAEGMGLLEAYRAMQAGQWSLAICLIDKVVYPTDARTATQLPRKAAA
jgi:hypothetical protein